jgi:ADP-L-glycero-D-manno-heptose 6-epimerase
MKYLITGGTGFVGSAIASELISLSHEVYITGSCPERVPKGAKFLPHNLNGIDLSKLHGLHAVFHQGANNNTLDCDEDQLFKSNVYASIDLFHACMRGGCKKFVYASSTAVYGNGPTPMKEDQELTPLNAYGRSKAKLDEYAMKFAEEYGVSVVGLRYCNVYGAGETHKAKRMSMVTQLALNVMKQNTKDGIATVNLFKDGNQLREWNYVKDVVKANMCALSYNGSGIFNCATGKPYTFNEVIEIIGKVLNKAILPSYIDNPHLETYQNNVTTDMTKSNTKLGFTPGYDLEAGCKDYLHRL